MVGWHETSTPKAVKEALLGVIGPGKHDHIVGQILIHTAQSIAQPRTETRTTWNLATRLDVSNCRVVINCFGKGPMDHTQFFGNFGSVREQ